MNDSQAAKSPDAAPAATELTATELTTGTTAAQEVPAAPPAPPGRWLHRWAVLIVALVWPLIWVGGQVTTYDAGMAVPDWPGTYGYNLFLYPYQTWLLGPFDLFIEHGHRLLGALVGMVAIVAVVYAFVTEPRHWVRWLSVAVLIAVIAQGALGGARVVLADRTLAMLHGCTAQLFFAVCVSLVVVTSRWWWVQPGRGGYRPGVALIGAVAALVGLSYLQVVLGAQLRHVQPLASPGGFSHLVMTHIATAVVVLLMSVTIAWRLCRSRAAAGEAIVTGGADEDVDRGPKKGCRCGDLTLSGPALLLLTLVTLQISLGLATWVGRYGMPAFAQVGPQTASYVVKSQAFVPSLIITAHVAIGAMVLVTAAYLLLRLLRARYARHAVAVAH